MKIRPDHVFKSVLDIDTRLFSNSHIIIFDIDNTLVFPETGKSREEIVKWFRNISKRYRCVCISNSRTIGKRKDNLSKMLNCEIFVGSKRKPSKKLFKELDKKYKIGKKKVVVVGDRLLTDVLFGNRNKAKTILVDPLTGKEPKRVRILRKIENILLRALKRKN